VKTTDETWRPIKGYAGRYAVSSTGNIMLVSERLHMRPFKRPDGYQVIGLCEGNGTRQKTHYVHRLVCEAFHGSPPSPDYAVAHNDGNRGNNHANNLRWATQCENIQDKYEHGTMPIGEQHHGAKLTEASIRTIFSLRRRGLTLKEIAGHFGVHFGTVARVLTRKNWKHVEV
jgi:hypothetical protein